MGEGGSKVLHSVPLAKLPIRLFSALAGCEVRPGGKLLQPGPTEYIRDKIDLSQSGRERRDEQCRDDKQRIDCLCVWPYLYNYVLSLSLRSSPYRASYHFKAIPADVLHF